MPLYRYVKTLPKRQRRRRKLLPFLLIGLGIFILGWTVWPILSFTLISDGLFTKVISPLSDGSVLSPIVLAAGSEGNVDFTNANTWFPASPQKKVVAPVNSYKLSIPRLKIEDATVIIAGDDLSKSLIHYGGTGLPGQYGTAVVFGHSTLPQFFNPQDYRTIFSTLPTLKVGDEIWVTYDKVRYRYEIFEMTVTEPNDLSPLEQKFDDSYITLITCVPPGTYWKRLNVKARLTKI
ncbi:MAG: sortase [Patescibacteria group bacterium]